MKCLFVVVIIWLLICVLVCVLSLLIQLQFMLLLNCFFCCYRIDFGRQFLKVLCSIVFLIWCVLLLFFFIILWWVLMCMVILRNLWFRNGMCGFMFQVIIDLLVCRQLQLLSVLSLCISFLWNLCVFGVLWKYRYFLKILLLFLLDSIIFMFIVLIWCVSRNIGVEVWMVVILQVFMCWIIFGNVFSFFLKVYLNLWCIVFSVLVVIVVVVRLGDFFRLIVNECRCGYYVLFWLLFLM